MILGVLALTGVCGMANANKLTINNSTPCTYDLSIGGIGNSSPSVAVPGISEFDSSPITTISGIKIMFPDVNGATIQLNVGNGSPFASSQGLPAPACATSSGYVMAIWQLLPSGDINLMIM